MNFIDAIFLFSVMATLAATPSTSVALVITRSTTLGLANGIAVATGIVIGDLIFVLLALLGLSVVSETLGDL
ncbi:MAG TPA: LysE family translocator, partial [Thiotrichales bacterium]|nr:LysE family translocator [Thiotrichales bacterium]